MKPHRGVLVLVLGILSIVLFGAGIVLGPIAWFLGNGDLKAMRAGEMDPAGEGPTRAGRLCGLLGVVFNLLCCFGYASMMVVSGIGRALSTAK